MPRYPLPGFKASRLIQPTSHSEDFGYRDEDETWPRRNPASAKAHRTRGPAAAPSPEVDDAIEREAMRRLKFRRGCPDITAENYVDSMRRCGDWWNDIPL